MIVVVDTGGTKTLVASFNNRGLLLKSTKFPTPKDTSEYIKALKKVLQKNGKSIKKRIKKASKKH